MGDMTDDPAFKQLMARIEAMPPLTPEQRKIIGEALSGRLADDGADQDAAPVEGGDEQRPADPA